MTARELTVACVLTPAGRGAVAVVAVEGSAAHLSADRFFRAANRRRLDQQPIDHIVYGHWHSSDDLDADETATEPEDLVVCRRSETRLEIHCHGGLQSSTQIVADLEAVGCEAIDPDQWLHLEHDCPVQAAAHQALARATTVRTASILLDQYHGALRRELEAILAALEAEQVDEAKSRLEKLLCFADFGQHLTTPWQVVIAGQPNVGKSSLINALVGFERAIVYDQPGTTRDIVTATTAIDGWPVELSDTAGLHETDDSIESAGIELARQRVAVADLIVWVLDATKLAKQESMTCRQLAEREANAVGLTLPPERTLLIINKCDLVEIPQDENNFSVGTCAVSGLGIQELLCVIAEQLVPDAPEPSSAILFALEQLELVQETMKALAREDLHEASQRCLRLLKEP